MGWKKPQTGDSVDIKAGEIGKHYEGFLTGKKEINTQLGVAILWQFKDDDKAFSIWGFTNLNFQMQNIAVGTKCRITYKGKSAAKNKYGKFPHQAEVEIDDAPTEEYVPE